MTISEASPPTKTVELQRGGSWSVVPNHRTERFDYSDALDGYVPAGVPEAEWHGDLAAFVGDQVSRIADLSRDEVWRYARSLTRFMVRTRRNGHALDVELLTPTHVDHFVASIDGSDRTRATIRSDLDRLGRALTRTAPWKPPRSHFAAGHRSPPYTSAELRSFRRDAAHQRSQRTTLAAKGMVALCAGAGVRSGELRLIRSDSIEQSGTELVIVHIAGSKPRSVPAARWASQELLDLADLAAGGWICGGRSAGKNYANTMAASIQTRQGVRLEPSRLRSTWIVNQIRGDMSLTDLLDQAGLSLPGSLDDYMQYVSQDEVI